MSGMLHKGKPQKVDEFIFRGVFIEDIAQKNSHMDSKVTYVISSVNQGQ